MAKEKKKGWDKKEETKVRKPKEVERDAPLDGDEHHPDENVMVNYGFDEDIRVATQEELEEEVAKHGKMREPEVAVAEDGPPPPPGSQAFGGWYESTYWTHFDWRADVKRDVVRLQKKFPNLTFANTYYCHPPVYGRKYEFVSADFWGGGVVNGVYVGYRGKPLYWVIDGWKVFNALMNDPYLPNIAWIIHGGRMWTRGVGWGPAPYGPAGSDAGHYNHVHCTWVL